MRIMFEYRTTMVEVLDRIAADAVILLHTLEQVLHRIHLLYPVF